MGRVEDWKLMKIEAEEKYGLYTYMYSTLPRIRQLVLELLLPFCTRICCFRDVSLMYSDSCCCIVITHVSKPKCHS